ncbi:hypothetical protein [Streptomyces phaeochromogenes]
MRGEEGEQGVLPGRQGDFGPVEEDTVGLAVGATVPPYWDIESVLWLRWCFSSARFVEVTPPGTT